MYDNADVQTIRLLNTLSKRMTKSQEMPDCNDGNIKHYVDHRPCNI